MKLYLIKLFCLSIAWSVASAAATKNRNVLFLLADDAGAENTLYNPGSSCLTPNLQKLAKRSVTFRRAFTAVSLCSPSRATILTGLPPHQSGQYGLQGGGNTKHYQTFDTVQSLPVILRQHGVRSGIVGKKHVAPDSVYKFDYSATTHEYGALQATRNITFMKHRVREFLKVNDSKPFFLYVGFGDPHRCDSVGGFGAGAEKKGHGLFCEKFGDGKPGQGKIQDWTPTHYDATKIKVPYYLPDTPKTKIDLAAYYTAVSRFDQGVKLMVEELERAGVLNSTLIIVTSDNGPPYINAKSTVYEPGLSEPLLVSNPFKSNAWGQWSNNPTSHLDMTPTILEWFGVQFPKYKMFNKQVKLTGQSLLKATEEPHLNTSRQLFASYTLAQVTNYYPMRAVRNGTMKLIHNIAYQSPYPINPGIKIGPSYRDLANRTRHHKPTYWFKTLEEYVRRPEWELFDLASDPKEKVNLYNKMKDSQTMVQLRKRLHDWLDVTMDPWINMPKESAFDYLDGQTDGVEFDN